MSSQTDFEPIDSSFDRSSPCCTSLYVHQYSQNLIKSNIERNVRASWLSCRPLCFSLEINASFLSISSRMNARSIFGLCRARDLSILDLMYFGRTFLHMQVFKNSIVDCIALIFPRVLTSKLSNLIWQSLYLFRKYLNSLLVVQNLKITFNTIFIVS